MASSSASIESRPSPSTKSGASVSMAEGVTSSSAKVSTISFFSSSCRASGVDKCQVPREVVVDRLGQRACRLGPTRAVPHRALHAQRFSDVEVQLEATLRYVPPALSVVERRGFAADYDRD